MLEIGSRWIDEYIYIYIYKYIISTNLLNDPRLIYIYIYIYISVCVCVCVCLFLCVYVCVCVWRASFNKLGEILVKSKIFLYRWKICIVAVLKLFLCHQNIFIRAIQFGFKSNWVPQVWTEVCHQIVVRWEVQTMWSFQKKLWYGQKSIF